LHIYCTQVVVRVHDACFTSEVLGSLKCDCREQLQLALDYIQDKPPGMVIYLQQEGRGIGLANKIAAYSLQEQGLDTVDANRALGLPDDCREYSAVGHILQELGVKSIRLMTNNPRKINELAALGINVVDRVPCIVKSQKYNKGYLSAKQKRMKHILVDEEEEELEGQYCFWDHDGEPGSAGIPLEGGMPLEDAARKLKHRKNAVAAAAGVTTPTAAAGVVSSPVVNVGLASKTRRGTPSDFECGGSAGVAATEKSN
jgi:GTP cyclohydrolase II